MLYQNEFSPPDIGLNQLNGTSANPRLTSSTATLIPRETYGSIMISTILFLTSELANKAEIYILSARDTTRAGASWVTM